MKVYEALAEALANNAETPVFGVLGDANAYLVDAFIRQHGGRYIAANAEAGAVLMALGAAMVSGQVGFATVTHGPALTNTVTPLVEAVRSFTPIVLLCGDTPGDERENLQNIDQRDVIRAAGAGFEPLRAPATALDDLARAVRRARVERRPIAFNMPANLLWQDVDPRPVAWTVPALPATDVGQAELDEAIGIIAAAHRPIVLAGRGAIDGDSRDALLALARRIEAPLATTMRAKGLFSGEAHVLGVYGTVSTAAASEAILSSDCVIAFGAGLNFHTTAQGAFTRGKRIIQVADRADDLGRNAVPDVAILGQPASVARTFCHWLDEAGIAASGFTREVPDSGFESPVPGRSVKCKPGTVDFLSTLQRLEAVLPRDRTLITDAGRWMVKSYGVFTAPEPRAWITTASFGSIGLGMGAAIGAAVARPDRPAVLLCGDGGFMLGNLAEFHTAVRQSLDLIVVVFNDGAYGAEHIQFVEKQLDPSITLFAWPDLVPLARALGGAGIRVASVDDIDALAAALVARESDKPLLVDIRLDPEQVAMW